MRQPLIIYVDVDETLVRNYGTKQIPIPHVSKHIRYLESNNITLYCWSSGGANYAKSVCETLEIVDCFVGFLPKPTALIDDIKLTYWTYLSEFHPNQCEGLSIEDCLQHIY